MWKKDKVGLKGSTRGNYFYMYEQYVENDFGTMRVQSVRRSDVRRFYNKMLDAKGLAMTSLDNIHTVLHQVFKLAVEDEYIRNNPTEEMMKDVKHSHNYQRKKRHALTIPEQTAFISYMRDNPVFRHWLPLFTYFLGTGCRVSEVTGIRWQDINMEENYIDVNHGVTYYQREEKKSYFSISTPKTNAGTRIIPMLPEVKKALFDEKEHQEECGTHCTIEIEGYKDFIFLNRFGCIHNPQTINRTIKRITRSYNEQEVEKAEKEKREPLIIPNFSCHNLRHTFATRYCENETNLKVIQEILGHKDIATTMDVYAEATKEAKVKSFNNLIGKIKIS